MLKSISLQQLHSQKSITLQQKRKKKQKISQIVPLYHRQLPHRHKTAVDIILDHTGTASESRLSLVQVWVWIVSCMIEFFGEICDSLGAIVLVHGISLQQKFTKKSFIFLNFWRSFVQMNAWMGQDYLWLYQDLQQCKTLFPFSSEGLL